MGYQLRKNNILTIGGRLRLRIETSGSTRHLKNVLQLTFEIIYQKRVLLLLLGNVSSIGGIVAVRLLPSNHPLLKCKLAGDIRPKQLLFRATPLLNIVNIPDNQTILPDFEGYEADQIIAHHAISVEFLLVRHGLSQAPLEYFQFAVGCSQELIDVTLGGEHGDWVLDLICLILTKFILEKCSPLENMAGSCKKKLVYFLF